ncbi:hypothetical protein DW082_10590 [Alistipes sp. AF48-12]|jgi:hypothetical protein bfra3_21495|nr:hypothetical protein DW082_10590 [Alistipes sp. AF48-12]
MRNSLCLELLVSAAVLLLSGCEVGPRSRRTYFFEKEKRVIIIPVAFNDTITGRFLFDTGATNGYLILDSSFCATHPLPAWSDKPDHVYFSPHTGWATSESPSFRQAIHKKPTRAAISNVDLVYNYLHIRNQKYGSAEDLQGTVGFPDNDSTHVWELNFEHNYLEIHEAEKFRRPADCYWLPFVNERGSMNTVHIQFPLTVKSATGDTVTIDYPYLIDTGMAQDFVLLPSAKEIEFFRKREDAVLINRGHGGDYRSRYDVNAIAFDGFKIDSMRIYTDEFATQLSAYARGIIGLNFLKRFNVFFDFDSRQVGLQPIRNFSRIFNNFSGRFYFSVDTTLDGRRIVTMMPDYVKNNHYKEAGLQKGDEIVAINGFTLKDLSFDNAVKIKESLTRKLDIVRDGKPMKITVRLDEDDLKGE